MGFRSTFVSEHHGLDWPPWFVEKWSKWVNIGGVLSAKIEAKTYTLWEELPFDIQKVLAELPPITNDIEFWMVYFHECRGVTKVKITPTEIVMSKPIGLWAVSSRKGDDVGHHYCYGCSDALG